MILCAMGKDAHPDIAEHLLSCTSCLEEEKILREMTAEQVTVPNHEAVSAGIVASEASGIGVSLPQKPAGTLLSNWVSLSGHRLACRFWRLVALPRCSIIRGPRHADMEIARAHTSSVEAR